MQSADEIWNGVLTARSIPRCVRLMAPTPTISRHAPQDAVVWLSS
jgi:hypothetical protein